MPDQYSFTTPAGTIVTGYYQNSPDEIPLAGDVAAILDQCQRHGPYDPALFKGLRVTIISEHRDDRLALAANNGELFRNGDAGLTHWTGLIEMQGQYATPRVLSHELGHWRMLGHRIWNGSDLAGQTAWGLFQILRGLDFTANTPEQERQAEDEADLEGADGVQGTTDPHDDGQRLPWNVPGEPAFLMAVGAVVEYWRAHGGIFNAQFNGADRGGTFAWWRGRWERYAPGCWEYFNGAAWTGFTA